MTPKPKIKFRLTSGAFFVSAVMLYAVPVVYLMNMLGAVIIHELGHIVTMLLCKCKIKSISVCVGGFVIEKTDALISSKKEIAVLLGGIVANIAVFLLLSSYKLGFYCLIYAVFNSLPICGFDGYRIIECMLGEDSVCLKIIGNITLFLLWIFAVYIMLVYPSNPSLFILVCVSFCSNYITLP